MENARFDLAAKYPPDTKYDDRPVMLRTLLEDRFKLVVHRESREVPGYALVVAKNGLRLHAAEPGEQHVNANGNGRREDFEAKHISMAFLQLKMEPYVGSKVIDGTGVQGFYDIHLHWTIDEQEAKTREEADAQRDGAKHGMAAPSL